MKILILLSFLTISSTAQWIQISSIPTSQLNAVKFFDQFTGIAVGNNGIWRSVNSGVNWLQVLNVNNVNALSFPDNNFGCAVADSGKIFLTANGGVNWTQTNSPVSQNLKGIWFVNSSTGYAVGQQGKILKSINGGSTWQIQTNSYTEDLNCVFMVDGLNGYIVGSSTSEVFAGTANGGGNWLYTLILPNNPVQAVSSIPIGSGYVLIVEANGRIKRSTSYGTSWTLIPSGSTEQLNTIQFLDGNTGYITGNSGLILQTTNSGLNWVSQSSPVNNNFRSINFINQSTGWIVGSGGVVLRTGIPVSINGISSNVPNQIELFQNYPNPFNPETVIKFSIPKDGFVDLEIYDVTGRKLDHLISQFLKKGRYNVHFDGKNYSSGLYIYKLNTNGLSQTRRMLLIK